MKPDLDFYFDCMPFVGQYMKADYNKCTKTEQLVELTYKWFNEAETSKNEVRAAWYTIAAENLYSIITNKSYASKVCLL